MVDNFKLIKSVEFDTLLLASSERGYGLKKQIHLWITSKDYDNANLMILLAYIIVGHKEWESAEIKIFAIFPEDTIKDERKRLMTLVQAGQLPISPTNIKILSNKPEVSNRETIQRTSRDADLTIIGFREESVRQKGQEVFTGYDKLGNILFVNAAEHKIIK